MCRSVSYLSQKFIHGLFGNVNICLPYPHCQKIAEVSFQKYVESVQNRQCAKMKLVISDRYGVQVPWIVTDRDSILFIN